MPVIELNMNGYKTYAEIPEGNVPSPVSYDGDKDGYVIDYGNGLVEYGGKVTITTIPQEVNAEGTATVTFPEAFSRVLSVTLTSVDIPHYTNEGSNHIASLTNSGFSIWATMNERVSKTVEIYWSAKGILVQH